MSFIVRVIGHLCDLYVHVFMRVVFYRGKMWSSNVSTTKESTFDRA